MVAVTWNPSDKASNISLSNNNLTATNVSGFGGHLRFGSTLTRSTGKFYYEARLDGPNNWPYHIGLGNSTHGDREPGYNATGWSFYSNDGKKYHNSAYSAYGNVPAVGDIIGVAVDLDTGTLWFSINNVWQASGDPAGGLNPAFSNVTGQLFPTCSIYSPNNALTGRFKSADFAYPPPTGFSAWEATPVLLSGTITESGAAVARTIRAYRRDTGALLAETVSIGAGAQITWDPNKLGTSMTLSNNNLTANKNVGSISWNSTMSTEAKTSGKWYFEIRCDLAMSSNHVKMGIGPPPANYENAFTSGNQNGYAYENDGDKYDYNGGAVAYGNAWTASGDVIGCAADLDAGKIWWSKNGVWQASGDPVAGTGQAFNITTGITYYAGLSLFSTNRQATARFKAADFTYAPPTGFSAWEEVGDGSYQFADLGGYTGEVYLIALDDDSSHNDLIYDRIVVT